MGNKLLTLRDSIAELLGSRSRKREDARRHSLRRSLRIEQFENRMLLSITGPELVSVLTSDASFQPSNSPTLTVAPKELTFCFTEGRSINAATLSGIQITRAGANGVFYDSVNNPNDMDDVVIAPGWVGLGDKSNQVIVRFSENLPDDLYHITFVGQGTTDGKNLYRGSDGKNVAPLKDTTGASFQLGADSTHPKEGKNFVWTFRLDLSPQVIAVTPQPVVRQDNGSLLQLRNTVEVYFSAGDEMATVGPRTIDSAGIVHGMLDTRFFQLIDTRMDDADQTPDSQYNTIGGTATPNDDVWINPTSVTYTFDQATGLNKAVLAFSNVKVTHADGTQDPSITITDLADFGTGSLRLRIGNQYQAIETTASSPDNTTDVGSSYSTSHDVTSSLIETGTSKGVVLSGAIEPLPYGMEFPGDRDEPGHRDLPAGVNVNGESHIFTGDADTSSMGVIDTYTYSFPTDYSMGTNLITESQKDAVRQMFALFQNYFGVQFAEVVPLHNSTTTADISIILGDPRAAGDVPGGPGGVGGVAWGGGASYTALIDSADYSNDDGRFGGGFWNVAMHEILHNLNFAHTYDQPAITVMGSGEDTTTSSGSSEPVYPGAIDIIHGLLLHRPDSIDIDLYKFTATEAGTFSAETIAERLASEANPSLSLLDTAITIFDENFNVVARNDDYFSKDSFINVHLTQGTYYVGVSAKGNNVYDPSITDSGIGGTTQGNYKLRLDYTPDIITTLTDATGQSLDGDLDGKAGGNYSFWFNVQKVANPADPARTDPTTIFVDKLSSSSTPDGTVANPYRNIRDAFAAAKAGDIVRVVGNNTSNDFAGKGFQLADAAGAEITGAKLTDGQTFSISDGTTKVTFEFDTGNGVRTGNIAVRFKSTDSAATIAAAIVTAVNATSRSTTNPLYVKAHTVVVSGKSVVALEGPQAIFDGGTSPLTNTLQDNVAYEIGRNQYGNVLADGDAENGELQVPQGVTLMIDAGAVFKLGGANIDVGSSMQGVDYSLGALQVLGTPDESVYFTSYRDKSIGKGTYTGKNAQAAGDWGGLVFRNDQDYAEGHDVLETNGIFLNYVNHADIRYGGGSVTIGSVSQAYSSIYMDEARPTLTFNAVSYGADAALSADPNSFLESKFEGNGNAYPDSSDPYSGPYTTDYDRVGPELWGNVLKNNTLNGIFVRVQDQAGAPADKLEVSARFDDTDIVYVIGSNLLIDGNPGGPVIATGNSPLTQAGPQELQAVDGTTIFEFNHTSTPYFAVGNGTKRYEIQFTGDCLTVYNGSYFSDGDTLTIKGHKGTTDVTQIFEFDTGNGVTAGHVAIHFAATDSIKEMMEHIAAAINADEAFDVVAASGSYGGLYGFMTLTGYDDQLPTPVVFNAANPNVVGLYAYAFSDVSSGRIPVAITMYDSAEKVAQAIAAAINSTDLFSPGAATVLGSVVSIQAPTVLFDGLSKPTARLHGRLAIDPGVIVKLDGSRIEAETGAQLLAEGTPNNPIIFTSVYDNTYGAGGTYATSNNTSATPHAGDWSSLYFGPVSTGSIDNAKILYGGGSSSIEGDYANFDVIEVHQAKVRIANTLFKSNTANSGAGGQDADRNGRGYLTSATIFVRGAQPVIVNNTFVDNLGSMISVDCNSMTADIVSDWGRSTGYIGVNLSNGNLARPYVGFEDYSENHGPLVHGNRSSNNAVNGMVIRGGGLTTETIWDDTDIVHVLYDEIVVPNFHTYGGIRLQSSTTESLVVKLRGTNAGLTASGRALEISDRIGGTVQILGTSGHPVIMTSLADDSVGAGYNLAGKTQYDTDNIAQNTANRPDSVVHPGDWRGIVLEELSNDRNVAVANEAEDASQDINGTPNAAQGLGQIDTTLSGGDENKRLGLEVHGYVNTPTDVDTYSFQATAGTEVWINIDKTLLSLDTMLELVDATGKVLARSDDKLREEEDSSLYETELTGNLARTLQDSVWTVRDYYSINSRDAGMRLILPGPTGQTQTYFVRVSSKDHLTSGAYRLQVRLRQTDEVPGSTIRGASIYYATNAIDLQGFPVHSPILNEAQSVELNGGSNNTFDTAQDLGNLLGVDRGTLNVGGYIQNARDVNWYKFSVELGGIQRIADVSGTGAMWPTIFDVDYADGMTRPDLTLWVFDDQGRLILTSTNSKIADDLTGAATGTDASDLSAGSFGLLDPFIGPAFLPETGRTYYVAVSCPGAVADAFNQALLRREPMESVDRVVEDHINDVILGSRPAAELTSIELTPSEFNLSDVVMYVCIGNDLYTYNPLTGALETDVTSVGLLPDYTTLSYGDIAMRNDGKLFTFTRSPFNNSAGLYRQLDTGDARTLVSSAATGINTYKPDPTDEKGIKEIPLDMPGGLSVEAMVEGLGNVDRGVLAVGNVPPATDSPYVKNLLYRFDDNGNALDYPGNDGKERLPTNIVPLAQLLTAGTFTVTKATQSVYATNRDILDGTLCTVNLANGSTKVFEFDCGPDIRLSTGLTLGANYGMVGAQAVRDGQTFTLSGKTYEFNSGPVLTFGAGASINAGDVVTLSDGGANLIKLVFQDKKGPDPADADLPAGAIAVQYATSDSAATIMDAVIKAINEAGANLVATGFIASGKARVSVHTADPNVDADLSSDNTSLVDGTFGPNVEGNVLINFEETQSATDFMDAIKAAVEFNSPGVTVERVHRDSYTTDPLSGDRITFYGATNADFTRVSSFKWVRHAHDVDYSETGVNGSNTQVIFGADDTMEEIADALRRAMELAIPGVTVTVTGGQVEITGAASVTADAPFTSAGSGPGGYVTGMAYVGTTLYAVSDAGGLYVVNNAPTTNILTDTDYGFKPVGDGTTTRKEIAPTGHGPSNSWINSPALAGFKFSGLTQGPQNVENSRYKDLLFATTTDGKLVCFDTTGKLQAVFAGGRSSIQLSGLGGNVTGVAFSTLDYNLWHETNTRALDEGHGINTTYDSTRNSANGYTHGTGEDRGLTSFYFGLENPTTVSAFNGPVNTSDQPDSMNYYYTNPSVYGTYNLPGGAMGSLVSQKSFSLKGYTAADVPRLYFDYYLDTENSTSFDGARVFVSTDGGANWNLVATNTDWDSKALREGVVQANGGVQLISNSGTWRQAVVDLGKYAGEDNIRLRFDFSTSSDFEIGDPETGGSYLEALAGNQLNDGLQFTIGGKIYEFDMGYSLNVPNAAGLTIPDGEQFTITDYHGNSQTFEFDSNGVPPTTDAIAISINSTTTAMDVATAIQTAITTAVTNGNLDATVTATISTKQVDNTGAATNALAVMVAGAVGLKQTQAPVSSFPSGTTQYTAITVQGDGAGAGTPGAELVRFLPGFTAAQVAQSIQQVVDPTNTSLKVDGALIHVYGLNVSKAGPMSYSSSLQGDHPGDKGYFPDRYHNFQRGQNNAHEGFYIDDIIVGFAERGELITGATTDTTFNPVPTFDPAKQVPAGYYQMEIREATPYGTWRNKPVPYYTKITNTIDTNDRLNQSISLIVPSVTDIHHLDTFTISDGLTTVTFQFVAQYKGQDLPGLKPASGYIPIRYTGTESVSELAAAIAKAINNAAQISHLFDVTAAVSGSLEIGSSTHVIRIDLFGAAKVLSASTVGFTVFDGLGDKNLARDQGQIIINSNQIMYSKEYGIVVEAGNRDANRDFAHPSSPAPLLSGDSAGLAPGISLFNNVIAFGNDGGIHISGDANTAGSPKSAIPFVRVVNNTIYGNGSGVANVGVKIDTNAAATLLNNVVANFAEGIVADSSSTGMVVVGETAYQNNKTNVSGLASVGNFAIDIPSTAKVFIDPQHGVFYPVQGSPIIDSSLNWLADRPALTAVRSQLGIPQSPIVAPDVDMFGRSRVDNPNVPNAIGLGQNIFKDRGAIEYVDFAGPTAMLLYPFDAVEVPDGADGDQDTARNEVQLPGTALPPTEFLIQLMDGENGSGINDGTVKSSAVQVYRDGVLLVEGKDYFFNFNSDTDTIQLIPVGDLPWYADHDYTITLTDAIRDTVGYSLDADARTFKIFKTPLPEIAVEGLGQSIVDGDSTPSALDGTDFGSRIAQNGAAPTHTFTVYNTGKADLILEDLDLPDGFTLVEGLDTTIAAGESDSFTVALRTDVATTYDGYITFKTNDADENPFYFEVTGTVLAPPEIVVEGVGQNIANGDLTPSSLDGTNFGTVRQGTKAVTRTFTVSNTGSADLVLNTVTLPSGFSITEGLSTTILAGHSDTFTVTMSTVNTGTFSGEISFATNDADENPFHFAITGAVSAAPVIEVTGLGSPITNGDSTPSTADGTNFGVAKQNDAKLTRTFTVYNWGSANLVLSSLALPSGFTIAEGLDTTILAGHSDTFTVEVGTTTTGTFSGEISFTTNDLDNPTFHFAVTATVAAAPKIVVKGGDSGNVITDGDLTPSVDDGTNFGSTQQNAEALTRTFTVYNQGTAALILGEPTLPSSSGFTITKWCSTTIAAGGSDTFTISLNTDDVGVFTGDISFMTNDTDVNVFNFQLRGTVTGRLKDVDTVGLYDRDTSTFHLRNTNDAISGEVAVAYGPAGGGWMPIVGDWNGDGIDTVGLYDPTNSVFHLRSTNDTVSAETTASFGLAGGGWMPIVGDWNGDGIDTIGLYDRSTATFYLKDVNDSGTANTTFVYGPVGSSWLPIVGDWNNDGIDTVGLYDRVNSRFYLKNSNDIADADAVFVYGSTNSGWIPVVGDWNGDNKDAVGLHDPFASVFYLKNSNDASAANATVSYGSANSKWVPLAGDWDGNHKTDLGQPAVSASDNTYTDKIRVAWNAVAGATSYEVWRNTANNLPTATMITSTTQTSFTDTTAVAGTQYWYWLKAKDSTGTGIFSIADAGRRQTLPATTPAKTYKAVEGNNTKTQVLATFSYANPSAVAGNFTPTVAWGGTVVGTPAVSLQLVSRTKTTSNWKVVGSAVYAENGTYGVTVSIRDKSNNVILSSGKVKFSVAEAALTNATPSKTYKSLEGNSTGTQVLAIFRDANPITSLSNYKATVNWGGAVFGTPTVVLQFVSRTSTSSTWRVIGSAVYQQKGSYTVSVSIKDVTGGTLSISKTKFSVADAPLADVTPKTTYNAVAGKSTGSQVLATFTDANPYAPASDYKATVTWKGTVTGAPSVSVRLVSRSATVSTWQVIGSATYTKAGTYAVQVKIADVHGSSVTINKTSFNVAALLTAARPAPISLNTSVLTSAELQPIVSEALARWAKAGLAASTMEKLTQVEFVLADLPGSKLGEASANRIYIDRNAAGHGWFVDSTPALDEEYESSLSSRQLKGIDPRVVDRIDLLTVVEHELGHIAGFDDLDALADNLMSAELGDGIRRDAYRDRVNTIFASE